MRCVASPWSVVSRPATVAAAAACIGVEPPPERRIAGTVERVIGTTDRTLMRIPMSHSSGSTRGLSMRPFRHPRKGRRPVPRITEENNGSL